MFGNNPASLGNNAALTRDYWKASMAGNDFLTIAAEMTDVGGAHVVTATAVIVVRPEVGE